MKDLRVEFIRNDLTYMQVEKSETAYIYEVTDGIHTNYEVFAKMVNSHGRTIYPRDPFKYSLKMNAVKKFKTL